MVEADDERQPEQIETVEPTDPRPSSRSVTRPPDQRLPPAWCTVRRSARWLRPRVWLASSRRASSPTRGTGTASPARWRSSDSRSPSCSASLRRRMFPSGIMAEQSTLRVWTDRADVEAGGHFPICRTCSSTRLDGPRLLHGFPVRAADVWGEGTPTVAGLRPHLPGRLGAVLVELPLRDGGYGFCPTWDELAAPVGPAVGERGRAAALRRCPHLGGAAVSGAPPLPRSPISPTPSTSRSTRGSPACPERCWPARKTSSTRPGSGGPRHGRHPCHDDAERRRRLAGAPRAAAPDARLLRARGRGRGCVFCR